MTRTNVWLIAGAAALAGALVGGTAVWALQSASITRLNTRAAAADAETQALQQRVSELSAAQTTSHAATPPPASPNATAASAPVTPKPPKKIVTVKQFAFVKKVSTTGPRPVITADYALMLTGTAAAKAAKAHGEESPPPNDYYIVNDNALLRKIPVKPGISVTVTTADDGTSDSTGHSVTFATWSAAYASPTSDNVSLREAPYWLTVTDGVITKIAEQYLP